MPGFEDIKGLGPAKAEKLRGAGIRDLKGLAEIDLRTVPDIGVGRDVIKDAKKQARRLLDKEGIAYNKSAYGTSKPSRTKSPRVHVAPQARTETSVAQKPAAPAPTPKPVAPTPEPRRGFFARILGR